jgi:ubiquinone/menaquinone biosynthesis C-methylase UbiE
MADTGATYSMPDIYDRHLGPVMFEPFAKDLARRVAVRAYEAVLETACGTGILTRQLRAHLPSTTRIVATDLSEPMLAYARMKLPGLQQVEWHPADATALPFPDASFGAVVCQFGLMFVPDKTAAIREARRVLTTDGFLVFNVMDSMDQNPYTRIAHDVISRYFPKDPPKFFEITAVLRDPETLRNLCREQGFVEIEVELLALEACSPSAKSFAIGLVMGSPAVMMIRERGSTPEPIIEQVATELARAGGNTPCRLPMRALVVTARASVS